MPQTYPPPRLCCNHKAHTIIDIASHSHSRSHAHSHVPPSPDQPRPFAGREGVKAFR